jgi:hypothetical protein
VVAPSLEDTAEQVGSNSGQHAVAMLGIDNKKKEKLKP